MAVAATSDLSENFSSPFWNEYPVVKARNTSSKAPVDIENNILHEIKRLKKARKRANTQSVVESLVGRMGLHESVVSSKLKEMKECGLIGTCTRR